MCFLVMFLLCFTEYCGIQQHRTWQLRARQWLQLPCGQVKAILFLAHLFCSPS